MADDGPDRSGTTSDAAAPHRVTAFEIVWRSPWVRAFVYVALAAALITLLVAQRGQYAFALQVGIIGFVIAYILNPVVELLRRLRIPRALAVILVYIVLLNLLVLGSVLLGQVVAQLSTFVSRVPDALQNAGEALAGIQGWLQGVWDNLPGFLRNIGDRVGVDFGPDEELSQQAQQQLQAILQTAGETLVDALQTLAERGPQVLVSGATSLISTTLQVFLILLASAYFLYDFPKFTANFRRFVPLRWKSIYDDLSDKADRAVGGYLRGQLLITTVLGVLIWIGLSIVGVPLALAISFLAAIFNLVPYLGPIIGVIPAVLLGFTVSPLTALLAVVVFVVANQLEGNVLSPLILSRSVNLHPVTVLLAIMVGLGLLGFVGALLAVPVAALTKVLLEDYLLTRPAYAAIEGGGGGGSGDEARDDDDRRNAALRSETDDDDRDAGRTAGEPRPT